MKYSTVKQCSKKGPGTFFFYGLAFFPKYCFVYTEQTQPVARTVMGNIANISDARTKRSVARGSRFEFHVLRDVFHGRARVTLQVTARGKTFASSHKRVSMYVSYQYVCDPSNVRLQDVVGIIIRDVQDYLPTTEDPRARVTLGLIVQAVHVRDVANPNTSATQAAHENERYQPLLNWVATYGDIVIPPHVIHQIYATL